MSEHNSIFIIKNDGYHNKAETDSILNTNSPLLRSVKEEIITTYLNNENSNQTYYTEE